MRMRRVLLAAGVAATIACGTAAALPQAIGTPGYPWVQPPPQVGVAPIGPTSQPQPVSYQWEQPPSWIPAQ